MANKTVVNAVVAKPVVKRSKKIITKAMLEKSLGTAMAEVDALSLGLARAKEAKDVVAVQLETSIETSMQEMQLLQQKVMFLTMEVERKDSLLAYIKSVFVTFASDWKALRGKPFKRFFRAVGLLGEIMDLVNIVINKIEDESAWGDLTEG